jgi:hypothetical protein
MVACAVAVTLAGCKTSDYLQVETPDRIPAGGLEKPENAALLVTGAIADFECAFGGYVVAGALIGEELEDATQTADRYPYDQRTMISSSARYGTYSCEAIGTYSPLQTARISADNIRRNLLSWTDQQVPNRQLLLATAAAYEGYANLLLGEGFCSTVLSTSNADRSINYGTEITRAQAFDSAITRFSEAITAAQAAGASATNLLNLAYVGRARAKLDKGDLAGARTDAANVPSGFNFSASASATSSRQYNRVFADNGTSGQASSVGAPYRNLSDPRVQVQNLNKQSVTGVPIWLQLKYGAYNTPIRLASYEEAQLIIAEADIATNTAASLLNAQTIINASRARGNETPLAAPTQTQLHDALITERRRALFLEGQHLGDLIRYALPLVPAANQSYPGGGTYGSQRCMPLPDIEKFNNPNLT